MGFRYIGSKTKIVDEVLKKISELVPPNAHIADIMSGTAIVSAELRDSGYQVTANDVMTYSYHHARVALLSIDEPLFSSAQDFINEFYANKTGYLYPLSPYEKIIQSLNNVPPINGYFWKEYSPEGNPSNTPKPRFYFTANNAKKIDGIRYWIKKLHQESHVTDLEHSFLIHDLVMAANDVANIAGTYGHYMSKITGRAKDTICLSPTNFHKRNGLINHRVIQGYAEDVASSIKCDLCYIDPPYMKRQYAANYHILETLAREDEPEAIGVSGLRPWRDQYSNFCTKTKIRNSFSKIFTEMQTNNFLISYSEDGLLSITDMSDFFSTFGEVSISNFMHKRFKSNNSKLHSKLSEYLIHIKTDNI